MSIKEITLYNFGQNKMTRKNTFFFFIDKNGRQEYMGSILTSLLRIHNQAYKFWD